VIGEEDVERVVLPAMDGDEGDEASFGGGEREVDGTVFVELLVIVEKGLAEVGPEVVAFTDGGAVLLPGCVERGTCGVVEAVNLYQGEEEGA
jgi:hypothetical protein